MSNSKKDLHYNKGQVAFLDILGFKQLVLYSNNIGKTKDLFEFIKRFQHFFNESPKLKIKVAFFSDSLVLTTNGSDLGGLVLAIWIAEDYLYRNLGLFFRGAITSGKYYHEGSIAFGPAIVKAYLLEQKANLSRIIIDDSELNKKEKLPVEVFKDDNGKLYLNTSAIGLWRHTTDGEKPSIDAIIHSLNDEKKIIETAIANNTNCDYSDKYIWRIKPYNYLCDNIKDFLSKHEIKHTKDNLRIINNMKISLNDINKKDN